MAHIIYYGADRAGRITTCKIKTDKQDVNAPCQLHVNGHDTDKTRLTKNVFANAPLEDLFEDEKDEMPSGLSALDYLKEANAETEYVEVIDEKARREKVMREWSEDVDALAEFSSYSFEDQVALGGLPSAYKIEAILDGSEVTFGENVELSKKAEAEVLDHTLKLLAIIDLDSKNKDKVFSEETHTAAVNYRKALFEPSNLNKDGSPKLVYDLRGSTNMWHGGIMDTYENRKAKNIDTETDYGHDISETLTAVYLGVKYEAIKDPEIATNVEAAVSPKVGRSTSFMAEHERYAGINSNKKGLFSRLFGW